MRIKEKKIAENIKQEKGGFFFSLNVLKLFLAVPIVFLHVTGGREAANAYLGVDFFFMITGFLMWEHREAYLSRPVIKSVAKRLGSFYFYYLFLIVFFIGLFVGMEHKIRLSDLIETAFFLNFDLIPKIVPRELWFLTAYVWVFIGYLVAMKLLPRRVFLIITAIITAGILNRFGTVSIMRDACYLGIPIGFLRGIAGMGLGILVSVAAQWCGKNPFRQFTDICLLGAMCGVVYIFFYLPFDRVYTSFCVLAAFMLFILSFKQGRLCQALEWAGAKFPVFFALSIPIYIYHMMVIKLLPTQQGRIPIIVLGITVAVSLVLFYVNRFIVATSHNAVAAVRAKKNEKSK